MGRYNIELNVPEDCPEGMSKPALEAKLRERLGLRAQDEVIINIRD